MTTNWPNLFSRCRRSCLMGVVGILSTLAFFSPFFALDSFVVRPATWPSCRRLVKIALSGPVWPLLRLLLCPSLIVQQLALSTATISLVGRSIQPIELSWLQICTRNFDDKTPFYIMQLVKTFRILIWSRAVPSLRPQLLFLTRYQNRVDNLANQQHPLGLWSSPRSSDHQAIQPPFYFFDGHHRVMSMSYTCHRDHPHERSSAYVCVELL